MFRVQIANVQLPLATSSAQSPSAPLQNSCGPFSSAASMPSTCPSSVPEMLDRASEVVSEDVEMKDTATKDTTDVGVQLMSSYDALQLLRDNNFDAVSRTAIMTLLKIVTNILSDPGMLPIQRNLLYIVMTFLISVLISPRRKHKVAHDPTIKYDVSSLGRSSEGWH